MFFVFLVGIALVAVGVGVTFGGGWATVGAVILLAIGLKVLFIALAFGFIRRRAREHWQRSWLADESGSLGPWPCGRRSKSVRSRMDEWHEMAHSGAAPFGGASEPGGAGAE